MRGRRAPLVAVLVGALFGVAACGGESDSDPSTSSTTETSIVNGSVVTVLTVPVPGKNGDGDGTTRRGSPPTTERSVTPG